MPDERGLVNNTDMEYEAHLDSEREWIEQGGVEAEAQDDPAQPDGYYGGYHVIGGERWWSEGALRAAEGREESASRDERAAIVKWLRESVGSGPASLLADEIERGEHRKELAGVRPGVVRQLRCRNRGPGE